MDKAMELINALKALTKAVAALTDKVTAEYINTFETSLTGSIMSSQVTVASWRRRRKASRKCRVSMLTT